MIKNLIIFKRIRNKKYITQININNKSKYLGYFDSPEEASAVYQKEIERL